MGLDEALLDEAKAIRDRMLELQHEAEQKRADYHHSIRRLHASGGSMREIAESLGLSHQRVHQIVDAEERPKTRLPFRRAREIARGGPFQRFTPAAREVVVHAQEEARALGHAYIGTEHLLLGLLDGESAAARAIEALGITVERARAEVVTVIGKGAKTPPGHIPFTPRAKKVLELSLREALSLGSGSVGPEHVLLGLLREGEGVGVQVLCALGADPKRLRADVVGLLEG